MAQQIYINLPVKDLGRSRAFFEALGFSFNPEYSNDKGACLVIGENIYAMLLTEEFFRTFTRKELANTRTTTEVLVCISRETPAAVDELVAKALANGGTSYREAKDHGFMYEHGFEDPDGHTWELVAMTGTQAG